MSVGALAFYITEIRLCGRRLSQSSGQTGTWYASCESRGVGHLANRMRGARERAGLSTQEISARTKIRVSALQALERGEYDRLPGDFYIRSFLKAYAREVGVPEGDLVRAYAETLAPAEPDLAPAPVETHPARPAPVVTQPPHPTAQASVPDAVRPPRVLRWPHRYNTPIGVGLAVVLLVSLISFRPADTMPSASAAAVGSGVAEAASTAVGTSGRVTPPDRLIVEIQPTAPIWVAATADGNSAIYRLLKPGEHVMVEAQKELSFRIGNAGAFVYSINGAPGRPLGGPDEVREFEITRENVQAYRR